jgi:hypothetical protein
MLKDIIYLAKIEFKFALYLKDFMLFGWKFYMPYNLLSFII